MDWQTAIKAFELIKGRFHEETMEDCRKDLLQKAVRYARVRADWELDGPTIEKDEYRTRTHDAFIAACDILGRMMDPSWRLMLGTTRQEIGDFACFVHCFLGILAR